MTQTHRSHQQVAAVHQEHRAKTAQSQTTKPTKPAKQTQHSKPISTQTFPANKQLGQKSSVNSGGITTIPDARRGNSTTLSWAKAWGSWVEKTLLKSVEYEELGMETVNARLHAFAQVCDACTLETQRMRDQRSPFTLTPKQQEALTLFGEDYSTTRIAKLLGVSRNTVESHLKNARIALGVASRKELAPLARALSLI